MPDPENPASHASEEQAFDDYLDAALEGRVEDVESFCARYDSVSDPVRVRLVALRGMLSSDGSGAAGDGARADALPLDRLGDFRLIRSLGEGGMGRVFLAEQESLGRLVAVKVIRPEYTGSERARLRFRREAEAVARLRHPHIVTVFAVGEEDGIHFLAMEFLSGRTLGEVIAAEGAAVDRTHLERLLDWFADIAEALHAAHESGIVHRDVKPSNITITERGRAVLVDFGLASAEGSETITFTGHFTGTPHYASPEQVEVGDDWSAPATDVYSLGATLYQAVTGRIPFDGATREHIFRRILTEEPPAPRRTVPGLPRDVDTVVQKAIEKDRTRRYASARELAQDLRAIRAGQPIRARPLGRPARAVRWIRRHRARATALAAAIIAILVVTGVVVERGLERRRIRRVELSAALDRARDHARGYRSARARLVELAGRMGPVRHALLARRLTPDETRMLQVGDREREGLEGEREGRFHKALQDLDRAEQIEPENSDVFALRADLYLAKLREARARHDPALVDTYRGLVGENDRTGRHAAELSDLGTVAITTMPPGARVHLFRYRELSEVRPGGDRRLVPVSTGPGEALVAPGVWALRVIRDTGDLRRGDLIVGVAGRPVEGTVLIGDGRGEIRTFDRLTAVNDQPVRSVAEAYLMQRMPARSGERRFAFERGGEAFEVKGESLSALGVTAYDIDILVQDDTVPIRVFRKGELLDLHGASDLTTRVTAAPLAVSPNQAVGTTPVRRHPLPSGSYVAVLRRDGHEPLRVPFVCKGGEHTTVDVALDPIGTTPEGFVRVAAGRFIGGDLAEAGQVSAPREREMSDLWISEFEVTRGEYLAFLNDPVTLAEIRASKQPTRFPRATMNAARGGFWPRERGRYVVPRGYHRHPVHGVSWDDARAYARWRTEQARRDGSRNVFDLPTEDEWEKAARGVDGRRFVFGNLFVPTWVNSRHALPARPSLLAGGRFPIDESPYGVYDLAGSVMEWCRDELPNDHCLVKGGCNLASFPWAFRAASRIEAPSHVVEGVNGFRLVLRNFRGERRTKP